MEFAYSDIIGLRRPVHDGDVFSRRHPKMTQLNRAKIFAPFAALTGFDSAVRAKEIQYVPRHILDPEEAYALNEKLNNIRYIKEIMDSGPYLASEFRRQKKPFTRIKFIAVAKEHQGQGHMRRMMEHAYYEVLPEKETPEEFTKTCAVIFEKDKQRKPLPRFLTVDSKGFVRLIRAAIRPIAKNMNRKLDSGEWQGGWRIEMETDHLNEGLRVALVGCPIYNFAIRHGYEKLMPAMCNCDFPGIDFLHAGLVRPRTVSNGDDRCDNWIVSADSDAIQKYPPEKRENGLLVSKDWR